MLKPIEAGCLAVMKNCHPLNEGKFVSPICYVGTGRSGSEIMTDLWRVKENVNSYNIDDNEHLGSGNLVSERKLMRIDGFTEESKAEQAEKELVG